MLSAAKITAFVATTAPDRAKAFYRDVLGLRLVADTPFALEFDAGGTVLRVAKVPALVPAPYTVLGWQVADLRSAVTALAKRGIGFEVYPGMNQDEFGIWQAPDGARVAWFKDADGNTLSLTQSNVPT